MGGPLARWYRRCEEIDPKADLGNASGCDLILLISTRPIALRLDHLTPRTCETNTSSLDAKFVF